MPQQDFKYFYQNQATNQTRTKTLRPTQAATPAEVEPTQPLEIKQPEQPAPTVHLESLAEVAPDESVYGTGWGVTELLNEFSDR